MNRDNKEVWCWLFVMWVVINGRLTVKLVEAIGKTIANELSAK